MRPIGLLLSFCLSSVLALSLACSQESTGGESRRGRHSRTGKGGSGGGGPRPGRQGPAAVPVRVETVERGTLEVALETFSVLEAERMVEVLVRETGRVRKIGFEEGAVVQEGQVLADLEDEELKIALQQAELREKEGRAALDRAEELHSRRMTSQDSFETAEFAAEQARQSAELARLRVRNSRIRAPIAGVLVERHIEVGDLLRANDKAFVIGDFDPLLAPVYLPENELPRLSVGQEAELVSDAWPERTWTARVRRISPVVDPDSGTVEVTLEIPESGPLRPGMYCRLRMVTEVRQDVVRMPKKALILEGEGDRAFVMEKDGARIRSLVLGASEREQVEVVSGLEAGERLITVGHEGLRDGTPVRVVRSDGTAEPSLQEDSVDGEAAATSSEGPWPQGSSPSP